MVKSLGVSAIDLDSVFTTLVAELDNTEFRCSIRFTHKGTSVLFEGRVFLTSREHWLDMDLEDFCEVFHQIPNDLDQWFHTTWEDFTTFTLSNVRNTVTRPIGGIVPSREYILGTTSPPKNFGKLISITTP